MLRIAFASTDNEHVNTHFGAAERFVIYDVSPGEAELVGVGEFAAAVMKGENKDKGLPRDQQGVSTMFIPQAEDYPPHPPEKPPEDKVVAKLEFLAGCAAVYAASIGASSIKRLMAANIQPIIVDHGHEVLDLLNEVSLALVYGGLAWVDRARARAETRSPDRFDRMEQEGWPGNAPERHKLIASEDELV